MQAKALQARTSGSRRDRRSGRSHPEAGLTLIDLVLDMTIVALLVTISTAVFSSYRARAEVAGEVDPTRVGAGEVGYTFPWAMVLGFVGLALVIAWLVLMSRMNKAKAEQEGAEWLHTADDDAPDVADPNVANPNVAAAPVVDPVAGFAAFGKAFATDVRDKFR